MRVGRVRRLRSPLLRTGPAHAAGETLLGLVVVTFGLLVLEPHLPVHPQGLRGHAGLFPLAGVCSILWRALRLRPLAGSWPNQIIREGVIGGVLGLVIGGSVALCAWMAIAAPHTIVGHLAVLLVSPQRALPPGATYRLSEGYLEALAGFAVALALLVRCGIHLWLCWNRLRRVRLRWALTHAHLTVVAAGAGLLGVLLVGSHLRSSDVLLYLVYLIVGTVTALGVVLLPSALFSSVVARRTTRRIEALVAATSALRAGDYGIRVPVEGEDEIARLQADFNAMAADLDRALRDLHTERDTVATLLQARRELIASVSHELRTPVATLRGYLESTRTHLNGAPPPTLRQDMQVMEREVLRLQGLIDDLFTLARAEIDRLDLRCVPTDVGLVVQHAVETIAPLAWQAGNIQVVAQVAADVPAALVDAGRLEQVVQNLLHNAVRHTPPGGVVAVVATADATAVVLEVEDTGEGIAPADLPRIWERFYRTQDTYTRPGGGTGLGLALVKELTEAMGGSVAVQSRLGEGTCFTLRLPLRDDPT